MRWLSRTTTRGEAAPARRTSLAVHAIAAALSLTFVSATLDAGPPVHVGSRRAIRKADAEAPLPSDVPALATLVGLHTGEHVVLDAETRTARFDELLRDRTTGEKRALDPRLLELLQKVAAKLPGARIELVSGYRSAKLNEKLRKKGRNVASHSQHSLGQAVDFRVVRDGEEDYTDPLALERIVRDVGWRGGVGVYLGKNDRFVHADVGPERRWLGR